MFCGLTSKLNFVYKRVNAMFIIIFWNFRYFRLYAPGETVNYNQLTQVMSGIFCGRGKEATDTLIVACVMSVDGKLCTAGTILKL
jgi:hypothetical protein